MTDAIFSLKSFKADFSQATKGQNSIVLVICVQNAFRPNIGDQQRIEDAVKSMFTGATNVMPQKAPLKGLVAGVKPMAWGVFDSTKQNGFETKLAAHVDALNAIYAYQRG